ncbi:hypothetical protein Q3G72_019720 [Acer saccharum]|nr:hypothetical protein Q3G72_019720 [Acer saccharum]
MFALCAEVEPVRRGRRKIREKGPETGIFRPALPRDSQAVVRLYAIAARTICASPEAHVAAHSWLGHLQPRLVPPESAAAEACHKLWLLFARVAQIPKEALRREAARAFYNDLDALAQRLDLPPLDDWEDLPEGIDDPGAVRLEAPGLSPEPVTLAAVRERARDVARGQQSRKHFPAPEAARLLSVLGTDERRELFETLIGAGHMGRSDVNLLIRFLVKGGEVTPAETALNDVLERLGDWLIAPVAS